MAILELNRVSKSYGSGTASGDVLKDISLVIEDGEFVAIVGFSGSGKTTLMSLMAGLIRADSGLVRFRGEVITEPGPERGLVFQSYALMPWLTVEQNIALAVDATMLKASRAERAERTRHYIQLVGLSHATDRRPAELSGGMRQRVAVARALAMRPEILLLDEPLSALDALTRSKLQDEIEAIRATERKTIVLVTNDVDEALLLADRIIPLRPGPNATLGTEFRVTMPRPRDRAALNHDPEYRRLRSGITQYLMDAAEDRRSATDDALNAPKIVPVRLGAARKKSQRSAPPASENRYVEFYEVAKVYPTPKGPLTVVDHFDLKMAKGEFISLIGHSGCGKSTVLSMVAGLAGITRGGIVLDGKEVSDAGPDRAVVFQSPSLLPWLTAAENVAIGVDRVYPHATRRERADIVTYYLSRVGLADALHKKAADLSNGMRQRVGIARAFALSPKLLLLDEPFGMLDALTRWELQEVLMEVWTRTQVTAICVTHDVDEAILLADRVVMMTNGPNARIGNIMQVDLPRPRSRKALLDHPKYYDYREGLLTFLKDHESGGKPHAKPAEPAAEAAA
ncbi:ABC transporter ATP-binding protein [Dongia deserti]|uniref:ABC transporter ATP-binding protein n=1 Tax=Dongia deserti TaxID=2268030 RepID=UPI000E6513BE|nr:nitrate ABC transporter ATP-binding protein [Dongia deserti]